MTRFVVLQGVTQFRLPSLPRSSKVSTAATMRLVNPSP